MNSGESLELNCESDRDTAVHEVKWFKTIGRNKVEQNEHRNKEKINVVFTDSENYECVVGSNIKNVKRQFEITVKRPGKHTINLHLIGTKSL